MWGRASVSLVLAFWLAAMSACERGSELSGRYALEKAVYDARQLEQYAYEGYPQDDYAAWRAALDAYNTIVALSGAFAVDSNENDSNVRHDCRRLILEAKIGTLRLMHLDYRMHDAVTHPCLGDVDIVGVVDTPWREGLFGVRVLYDSLGADPAGRSCDSLMREVVRDPILWEDNSLVGDSPLVIPLSLAAAMSGSLAFADSFYSRVVSSWPDSASASTALEYRARVRSLGGRYGEALADVDSAIGKSDPHRPGHEGLLLLRGEILAFGTKDVGAGRRALRDLIIDFPGSDEAWTARLCIAMLAKNDGVGAYVESLRAFELDKRGPAGIASRAMLMRAIALEESGEWEDASAMFWQICRLYPYTPSALSAPLRVLRHVIASRQYEDAERWGAKASSFYLGLIERDSARMQPPGLPKDYYIESHLLCRTALEAAEGLGRLPTSWSADNAAVAAFKSALIYKYILEDPENSAKIAQKSLALFPGSRYLRATRRELNRIAPARGVDTGSDSSVGSR